MFYAPIQVTELRKRFSTWSKASPEFPNIAILPLVTIGFRTLNTLNTHKYNRTVVLILK